MRFLRQPVAFARITFDARTDHVFPSCRSSAIARNHVVEIQIAAFENLAAILAGVLVALENVVPGKLHLFLWQPIEQ